MCELLIHARNNTHADPKIDRRGCYKRGMPVVVYEDGHVWGRLESKQTWIAEGNAAATWPSQGALVILKIPGVPASQMSALCDVQMEDDAGAALVDAFRRRRWQFALGRLPVQIKDTLNTSGEYTATKQQVRAYLRRIRDDVEFAAVGW